MSDPWFVETATGRTYHRAKDVGGMPNTITLCGYRPPRGWAYLSPVEPPHDYLPGCGRCHDAAEHSDRPA